jgi:signal transduction histidine kinase
MQATLDALSGSTPLDAGDLERFVEQLSRSAIWITDMIDHLSTRAAVSDGAMALEIEPVNVRDWLEQAIALVQPIAEQRGQSILLASPRPSPVVSGDRFWLRQVMLSLLANACRHGAWADTIAVSVIENDEFVSIRVSDHGVGVLPDERDRILERLVRGTRPSVRQLDGQGLGLRIVRTIVERHAGTMSIDSAAGQGSTFTVRLPATRAPASRAPSKR